MSRQNYQVLLNSEDREYLYGIIKSGKHNAQRITRARVLLKADKNGPAWTDRQIREALEIGSSTAAWMRRRYCELGLRGVMNRKPRDEKTLRKKLDGAGEAKLIAMVCSEPPEGYQRWTLRLLASRLVKFEIIDSISHETVRQTLKKITSNHG